jgi:hypothetical protein
MDDFKKHSLNKFPLNPTGLLELILSATLFKFNKIFSS